jgi:hypothetical protein
MTDNPSPLSPTAGMAGRCFQATFRSQDSTKPYASPQNWSDAEIESLTLSTLKDGKTM